MHWIVTSDFNNLPGEMADDMPINNFALCAVEYDGYTWLTTSQHLKHKFSYDIPMITDARRVAYSNYEHTAKDLQALCGALHQYETDSHRHYNISLDKFLELCPSPTPVRPKRSRGRPRKDERVYIPPVYVGFFDCDVF